MIKFALRCSNGHEFESWFRDGGAFEAQAGAGMVSCAICQDGAVSKAIMAPALALKDRQEPRRGESAAASCASPAVSPCSKTDAEMRELTAELRRRILENSDNLGEAFAEEALKIHQGEAPDRPIHGQANLEEARLLVEEGVAIFPLPRAPGELN